MGKTLYCTAIFKLKPKFKQPKVQCINYKVHTTLPNYTVLIVVLSKLHVIIEFTAIKTFSSNYWWINTSQRGIDQRQK